jgi:hypothetical protein
MRSRLTVITIAAAALLALADAAQAQTAGVTGGANLSTFSLSPDQGVTFRRLTGWAAGIFFGSPPEYGVALQPEILVSIKGTKDSATPSLGGSYQLMYLDIPVLFRVFPVNVGKVRIYEFGGPFFSFLLHTCGKPNSGGACQDTSDQFSKRDAGFTVGGGVDVGRFMVDVRGSFGIANIGNTSLTDIVYRSRAISVMGGWRFKYDR